MAIESDEARPVVGFANIILVLTTALLWGLMFYVAYHEVEPLFHRWLAPEFQSITYLQCCSIFVLSRFLILFLFVPLEARKEKKSTSTTGSGVD